MEPVFGHIVDNDFKSKRSRLLKMVLIKSFWVINSREANPGQRLHLYFNFFHKLTPYELSYNPRMQNYETPTVDFVIFREILIFSLALASKI